MTSLTGSSGNAAPARPQPQPGILGGPPRGRPGPEGRPFVLAVTSHKGGTGRTTLSLALAWLWGQRGLSVTLVDADPVRAACLVAAGPSGVCPWDNVNLVAARQGAARIPPKQDIVVIDAPPATEPLSQKVFAQADGVVLTSLADPLSLATLPAATVSIRQAQETNPGLELLGLVVGLFNAGDLAQTRCLSLLRGAPGELFVEPPVPLRAELRDWAKAPGGPLPAGPARGPLNSLADTFREHMAAAGWGRLASRKGETHAHAVGR